LFARASVHAHAPAPPRTPPHTEMHTLHPVPPARQRLSLRWEREEMDDALVKQALTDAAVAHWRHRGWKEAPAPQVHGRTMEGRGVRQAGRMEGCTRGTHTLH
jgi:hypothetical protein